MCGRCIIQIILGSCISSFNTNTNVRVHYIKWYHHPGDADFWGHTHVWVFMERQEALAVHFMSLFSFSLSSVFLSVSLSSASAACGAASPSERPFYAVFDLDCIASSCFPVKISKYFKTKIHLFEKQKWQIFSQANVSKWSEFFLKTRTNISQ